MYSSYYRGEGRGTYAHPFPLQQNDVSDFFGHKSILTIWKQETSSKKPPTFSRRNALELRCPLKTCNLCVEVAPCRHMRQVTGRPPL